jgi:PAS domain S-box-containing protein
MQTDDRYRRAAAAAEEALRQAEELNRRIVESTGDCVKILALDGRILYMNPAGLRMLEMTDAGALLNRPIGEFFEGEVRRAADEAVGQARSGGRGRFQYLMRTASGLAKWWDAVITPITDAHGSVVQLLAVSRDITERRREESLRAAQHQLLGMIATGNPLPVVLDALVRMVEQQADGMLCSVLLLDEDGLTVRHGAAPSLPERWSTPIFSPERQVLGTFAMYSADPRAPTDEELGLIDTAADIARIAIEQQRAYQALRRSEARNQAILRAIPDWMFLTTVEGIFLDYHATDATKLHVPPSAFLGRNIRDVLPPPIADVLAGAFVRVGASDEAEKIEYRLGAGDTEREFEACIVRCDGDKILSIVRDVTDRKRAELEADAHREELAHLSRVGMLGELSGALAHELSQPLTAVLTNAQAARNLLERYPLDVELLRATLDDIIRSDKRAGAVVDRLRALLRKDETIFQPVDVGEVVREVLDLASGELSLRRVTVTSPPAPPVPVVLGDRVQLQQVVLNLVLNACDAMSLTDVSQRQMTLSTAAADGFVELAVSDRGPGIPEEQLERVFEPFVTFRQQGLGLGLAISRSIVTAHGGSIRAENNAGGGATFRCLLPIAATGTMRQAG